MRGSSSEREYLLLDLYSCYLLPAYTLLFAGTEGWMHTNFSVLAVGGAAYYRAFLVWGVVTTVYFSVLLARLTTVFPVGSRWKVKMLMGAALISLLLGIPLPYLPDIFPQLSKIHILLCFSAGIWLMAALLAVILGQCRKDPVRGRVLLCCWWCITAGSGVLFCLAGMVSSALEIYFVLSAALLCRKLYQLQEEGWE